MFVPISKQANQKFKENLLEFKNLMKNWELAEKQYMAELEAKDRKVGEVAARRYYYLVNV